MKLIDADTLMKKYKEHHDFYLNAWDGDFKSMDAKDKARCDELTNCIAEIVNAPSIDIVRCGECKHWDTADGECYADRGIYFPKADDYCSYGERKESE